MTQPDPVLLGLIQQVFQIEARQRVIIEILCGQTDTGVVSLATPEWFDHRTREVMSEIASAVHELTRTPE